MTSIRSLDELVRVRLRQWPQRPPGIRQQRNGTWRWLRGRPSDESTIYHPFLKFPGSSRLRTLPDGLWLNFGGSPAEPFVDIFAIEACASISNLLDKRSRFAPSTHSLMAVCPVPWLLAPITTTDPTARWVATGVLRAAPETALVLPIRDIRVMYALKTEHYEVVLKAGDMDAAIGLIEWRDSPAQLRFFYMDLLPQCFERLVCAVTVGPLTDEFRERTARQTKTQGAEFVVAPEGTIEIVGKPPADAPHKKDGTSREEMTLGMPYARIDGHYTIISMHYTPAKVAELKAKTAQAVADETLAQGVGNPRDLEWKQKASALPAGGGEPGLAFSTSTAALAGAVKSGSLDAVMATAGDYAKIIYRDKDTDGTSISLKTRQLKLRAQAVRYYTDATVLGGYLLGDTAALVYEGHNGAGWIVRGVVLMEQHEGLWGEAGRQAIEIPPN